VRGSETTSDISSPVVWDRRVVDGHRIHERKLYLFLKRMFDVILASLLLVLLSPVLLVVALAIRLDSRGGAIYSQTRVGYDWHTGQLKPFKIRKFRSMQQACDESIHREYVERWAHREIDNDEEAAKLDNDERVTRVGRLIRRTSVDELPQLWNVVRGDMSLVGPRPVPLYEVQEYEPWHRKRLETIPGMTGLWQVKARGQVTIDQMAELDIEYIGHQSMLLDLKILVLTIPAVVRGRGAK